MILRNLSKNFYIIFISIVLIFSLDRISKLYVIKLTETKYSLELFSSKFLNISLIWNEGIAFGLFSFDQNYLYNLISIIILLILIIVFVMMLRNKGFKKYSLMMIFGGAIGNFYDRITYGAVPDFIDLHYKTLHWFTFNVADIFITLGIIAFLMSGFFIKINK